MRLGELKPKGSDKTFHEWVRLCINNMGCRKCPGFRECCDVFDTYSPFKLEKLLEIEVEVD